MIDPSDGAPFAAIARGTAADVDAAVRSAQAARAGAWGHCSPAERGRTLMAIARAILAHADELALVEARDCGKPVKQARADVAACARYFEFYARRVRQAARRDDSVSRRATRCSPGASRTASPATSFRGTIRCRSSAARVGGALAAGNACVVKPAEDACLSLLRVAELAAEAGLPEGALNIVTGSGARRAPRSRRTRASTHISFTGSPATGAQVAAAAAQRHCPVTLELGGKSPQIVFADADLDAALPALVNAIVQNAGQTCSAGSRLLVRAIALRRSAGERLGTRIRGAAGRAPRSRTSIAAR